jgi:hypothetical protein
MQDIPMYNVADLLESDISIICFYQLWQNVEIFPGFITVQISVDHCLYGSIKPLYIISFSVIHGHVMIDVFQ